MKILMVCAEFAPWAKTGGLADAVAGLSDALSASGHDVRVLLPRYAHLEARGTRHTVSGLGGPFRITELEPEPKPDQDAEHAGKRRTGPRIFVLDRTGIHETRYQDTEHYAVTKTFLDDPARMLGDIFREIDIDPDR